jgi:hypothetical protein
MQGQSNGPLLRAVRSLHRPLAKQLARFTLVMEMEGRNPAILSMLDWAATSLVHPSDVENEAPLFAPQLVNGQSRLLVSFICFSA